MIHPVETSYPNLIAFPSNWLETGHDEDWIGFVLRNKDRGDGIVNPLMKAFTAVSPFLIPKTTKLPCR